MATRRVIGQLPTGEICYSTSRYVTAWRDFVAPFERLGWRRSAYDPGVQFRRDDGTVINLDIRTATEIRALLVATDRSAG